MPTSLYEESAGKRAEDARPGESMVTMASTCGFVFTTTGRPCANHVAEGVPWCRAGHPRSSAIVPDDPVIEAPDRSDAPVCSQRGAGRARRPQSRTRRATELLRQAMASEDADQFGLRAEHVLADAGTALTLLGGPDASPAARAAVVQRFGRVGALLVLGYEERGRARHSEPLNGLRALERSATGDRHVEYLVRDFSRLDSRELYELLCEIDEDDGFAGDEDGVDAHRWLHATYAVAARDGTPAAHRAYMRALDRVMRLVRPLVAS
jgi:hypothetical protein